jgi:hypothetical protein
MTSWQAWGWRSFSKKLISPKKQKFGKQKAEIHIKTRAEITKENTNFENRKQKFIQLSIFLFSAFTLRLPS